MATINPSSPENYEIQIFNLPSEEETQNASLAPSPTIQVTRQENESPVFHVVPMGPVRIPKLYIVYGKYQTEMTLTADEQTALQKHIEDLLKNPDIANKLGGREPESINLSHLCIDYIKDARKKTMPIAHDLPGVVAMRKFCNQKSDPKNEFTHSWPQRSPGMRTTIQREHGTQKAYARTPDLQRLKLDKKNLANAFDHTVKGTPLSGHHKAIALQRTHLAADLKRIWLDILQLEMDSFTAEPRRLEAFAEAKSKLENMWSFALQFEMAHPLFRNESTPEPLLPLIQKKQKAASDLISKLNPKAPKDVVDELANDLGRTGIENPEGYRQASKALKSPMKLDPLEDAFALIVKRAVNGNWAGIEETFNSWAIQDLLNSLGADKGRIEAKFKGAIQPTLEIYAQISATPLDGATSLDQIQNFDKRYQFHKLEKSHKYNLKLMQDCKIDPNPTKAEHIQAKEKLDELRKAYTALDAQIKPSMIDQEMSEAADKTEEIRNKIEEILKLLAV